PPVPVSPFLPLRDLMCNERDVRSGDLECRVSSLLFTRICSYLGKATFPLSTMPIGHIRDLSIVWTRRVLMLICCCLGLLLEQGLRAEQQEGGRTIPNQAVPSRVDSSGDSLPAGVLTRMGSSRFRQKSEAVALAFSAD